MIYAAEEVRNGVWNGTQHFLCSQIYVYTYTVGIYVDLYENRYMITCFLSKSLINKYVTASMKFYKRSSRLHPHFSRADTAAASATNRASQPG